MDQKKLPITAFSSSQKSEVILNRIQRETGKNRSQVIRDLISSAAEKSGSTPKSFSIDSFVPVQSQEFIIKSFFEIISAKNILLTCQAVINRGDRVLIILPKKPGQLLKYSTWEFPSCQPKSLDIQSELTAKLKKELGVKVKVEKLVLGRLVPEVPLADNRIISVIYHCRIASGKIAPASAIKETKWVPVAQLGRYFTTSLGDPLITWLSQLK